jgi:hypothetical protein
MNCDQCQYALEEYVDGELDSRTVEIINLHLHNCSACETELQRLRAEFAVFEGARLELDSTKALWAGVAARLNAETNSGPTSNWWSGLFYVPRLSVSTALALVILAVVVTVVSMKRLNFHHVANQAVSSMSAPDIPENRTTPRVVVPAIDRRTNREDKPRQKTTHYAARNRTLPANDSPDNLVREAQQKYVAAIQLLSRDVARNRSNLDPSTRLRFEEALSSIDRTILATRRVVRRSPDDPVAVQYMLAAYAKKVDVLREMANGGGF